MGFSTCGNNQTVEVYADELWLKYEWDKTFEQVYVVNT